MLELLRRTPRTAGLATIAVFALTVGAATAAPSRGKVVALDKRTGRAAWEAPVWSKPEAAVLPLVTPELIYVVEDGRVLKALDAVTGKPRWQATVATRAPLTLSGDRIVVVQENSARALNRWTGKKAWDFNLAQFTEWKFDENTVPLATPGRVLLPARTTLIGLDATNGQPTWAYTVAAAKLPLQPVVVGDMVYLRSTHWGDESEVALRLEDGLPETGEYALPPDLARAIERERKKKARQTPVVARPAGAGKKTPFIAVQTKVAPGGKALAAAGAKRWSFPAPTGWTIEQVAGESAGHLYALLGTATTSAPKPSGP